MYCTEAKETEVAPEEISVSVLIRLDACMTAFTNRSKNGLSNSVFYLNPINPDTAIINVYLIKSNNNSPYYSTLSPDGMHGSYPIICGYDSAGKAGWIEYGYSKEVVDKIIFHLLNSSGSEK